MKMIFVILLFINAVAAYSQIPNFDINIHDIQIMDRHVSFRYTIKNESGIPVWFHRIGGGFARLTQIDNILFIAPVYDYATSWIGTGPAFNVETIKINPGSEINIYYDMPTRATTLDGKTYWEDFSTTNYIDLILIFTLTNVGYPVTDEQYRMILATNAILVNRLFEVR